MAHKEFRPKWLAVATLLSVFGGIAMTIVGSLNGINGLVTAGLVVAFGLTMVLNVGTAIFAVVKSVKEDGKDHPKTSTPQNRAGCIIGVCILILFISVPLVATVFFSQGKEAIGGAIIGGLFAAVILAIIIANVRQKAKNNNYTKSIDGGSYTRYFDEDEKEEKSSFERYMEADDAFEEFIDGDADIFLSADEYEKVIDEGDRAYDEYMLECDKYGGESQGEILYAQKIYEIIRKYKLIIKSKNPEYEIGEGLDDADGKKQMLATLVDALKQVAEKKTAKKVEILKFDTPKIEKPQISPKKPSYATPSYAPKSEEVSTEQKPEKVEKIDENNMQEKQENTAAPKRATIAYKGIKKK